MLQLWSHRPKYYKPQSPLALVGFTTNQSTRSTQYWCAIHLLHEVDIPLLPYLYNPLTHELIRKKTQQRGISGIDLLIWVREIQNKIFQNRDWQCLCSSGKLTSWVVSVPTVPYMLTVVRDSPWNWSSGYWSRLCNLFSVKLNFALIVSIWHAIVSNQPPGSGFKWYSSYHWPKKILNPWTHS